MTTTEFNDEFDIHYNSIAGQSAPNIDLYEKSVYLTKAQLELVKNYYNPTSNQKSTGFEATEKRRVDLKELTRRTEVNTFINSTYGKVALLPEELYLIVREDAIISDDSFCNGTLLADVKPMTFDEFNIQRRNPFKNPDHKTIWRLDHHSIDSKNAVELISKYKIENYIVDYLMYPTPIILTDLQEDYPNDNLTIDGFSNKMECMLNQGIHREIIDRAVELALRDYRPQDLESKLALDRRNE